MLYVEFYNNYPMVILTEMTQADYLANEIDDIRTFESLDVFVSQYPRFKVPEPRKDNMPQYRREAMKAVQDRARYFQELVVGTNDGYRFERFKLNVEAAKALILETETDAQRNMLQIQLDANKFIEHPVIKDLTLDQFAGWIVAYEQITILGSGYIEDTLIRGKATIEGCESKAEIDQALIDLEALAQTKYAALIALLY